MSDEKALLAAIFAQPEEDTPRLMYADWLDEQGGESNVARAEYIRREIDHARSYPTRWSQAKQDARKRAEQLFAKHGAEWFPRLVGRKNIFRGGRAYPSFQRGFPYRLLCEADKLLEIGDELLQLAPITEVEFRSLTNGGLQRLIKAPWVRRFRKLNLSGGDRPPTDWAALADCPYLTDLPELLPYAGMLTVDGAARVAAANPFPKLKRLFLGMAISDEAVGRLFHGPAFTNLDALKASPIENFGRAGIEALTTAPALANLKSLDVSMHTIPGIAKLLTSATFWPRLEGVRLLRCGLGDEGLTELVICGPTALRCLELNHNGITAVGMCTLAESPMFEGVAELDLWGNSIGDVGLLALARSPRAKNLRKLNLFNCAIGLAGIKALAESPHLTGLRELHIGSNINSAEAAKALAASPHLGGLTDLCAGHFTDAGKKHLKARFGAAVSF